jgi:hypothetical protein
MSEEIRNSITYSSICQISDFQLDEGVSVLKEGVEHNKQMIVREIYKELITWSGKIRSAVYSGDGAAVLDVVSEMEEFYLGGSVLKTIEEDF